MDYGLAGKVVLVTGGSGGIGGSVAKAFAAEGATIAVAYRNNPDSAKALAAELGENAIPVHYSLTEPESAVEEIERRWGGVDVLVAGAIAAGAKRRPGAAFEQVEPADYGGFLTQNLTGSIRTTQLVLPGMRRRGWGRIVLISSVVVRGGKPGREIYGAAKAGLHGFASSLSWDVGPDGVLVNVVCPGLVLTEQVVAQLPAAAREAESARTPTGRLSTPDDVAGAVLFLGSGANGNITGQVLTVAGGR